MKGTRVGSRDDVAAKFNDALVEYRSGKCQVYWGFHACDRDKHHTSGMHQCSCGECPHDYSVLWGEDLTQDEVRYMPKRQQKLMYVEQYLSMIDEFDTNGKYRGPVTRKHGRRDPRKRGKTPGHR